MFARFPSRAIGRPVRGSSILPKRVGRAWLSSQTPASADGSLPLEGYKVLDMTRVLAGPYCTQILGDLGAEVIKIEHPVRGDDTRAWGPPYAKYKPDSDQQGPGESAYFLGVNRNKKSLALSFQDPAGVEILHKLAATCDILVENYIPGALKKYGMDYDTIHKINPRLIYASITGYGQTGPYSQRAGYDVMVEAEFGLMHITGSRDGPPVKVGVAVTDLTTGLYTSNSIMAALLARAKTGRGQHIDAALSDCQTATLANIASSCLVSGEKDTGRWGTAHPSIVPYKSFETKDGDILFGGGNDRLFGILCDGLGRPEWKEDPKFKINAQRVAHRDELEAEIEAITKTRTTQEWLETFEGKGMPYAAVNDVLATLTHEHTKARNMVVEVEHEQCGPLKLVNSPVKYSETKPRIRSPPPTLGQHTDVILKEHLGYSEEQIQDLRQKGVNNGGADNISGTTAPAPPTPVGISTPYAPTPSQAPEGVAPQPRPTATPDPIPRRDYTPASQSPSTSRSGLYVPQFSAATQMILNRMKTEAGFGTGTSGVRPSTPEIKSEFKAPTYEDVKRRVIQGMNTTPTLQMPAAPRPTPPLAPAAPHVSLPLPQAPVSHAGYHAPTIAPRAKMASGAAGLSAIRRVTLGLTASGRPIQPKPERQPNPPPVPAKEKKPRAPWGSKAGTKRKRAATKGQDDETSSLSSLSDASGEENEASDKPATPSAPPILTKSGRHVQKPTTYNPAEMESSSAKKRTHYSKTRTVEQALCKKCTRMHSPASNQIVFCDGCNEGWHQMCHDPWIDDAIVRDTKTAWFCSGCQAKREKQHYSSAAANNTPFNPPAAKRQKLAPVKESWADRTPQQKRAFLSTLPHQELVGLLMYSLELHPDLPIFPGTPDTPPTPGTPQTPSDMQPNGRKLGKGQKGVKGLAAQQQQPAHPDNDEEVDPLEPPWPKPGNGLYTLLPPEDDDLLADDNDYESFSVIVYDERGRKVEENGIPVLRV
ncbi:CoA-transferase family III domain-containing protein [Coniochaeta sp. 2T2.1]|nr:CoA-transferase family III domain-containing protein [Coniochaeta sp. 2T2.1]